MSNKHTLTLVIVVVLLLILLSLIIWIPSLKKRSQEASMLHNTTVTQFNFDDELESESYNATNTMALTEATGGCRGALKELHVAIYAGPGTWRSGLEALFLYLESRGIKYDVVNETQILGGSIENYNVLVIPGGWAYDYFKSLGYEGENRIKEFVGNGGGYLGICAGAFYASRTIIWESRSYYYSLNIANVDAVGPKEGFPWPTQGYVAINLSDEVQGLGLNKTYTALYYGGPELVNPGSDVYVLAVYGDDGEPAVVLSMYGSGRIALTGVHLEVREETWPILDVLMGYLAGCWTP